MADAAFVNGMLSVLGELMDGGGPGKGTSVIDRTQPDGSGNNGLFATLERLDATRASAPTALGLGAAAHAAHAAFYLEVALRWAKGDHSPADWPGSFAPATVDAEAWRAALVRLHAAYDALVAFARANASWNEDDAGGLAAAVAHCAYHLGAVRQVAKLASRG